MLFYLLPTLLTAGLIWWLIDENSNDDDNDTTEDTGDGTETLTDGNDVYRGDGESDILNSGAGNDMVATLQGDDRIDLGAGSDLGIGGNGADVIAGRAGDDVLNGSAGNDKLYGGTGDDILGFFGAAKDMSNAELGALLDGTAPSDAEVSSFLSKAAISDGGNDLLQGGTGDDQIVDLAGNNTLIGAQGDDFLWARDSGARAGSGVDRLFGGSGDDLLSGDDGDVMFGGAGSDEYLVNIENTNERAVVISDLELGETIKVALEGAPLDSELSYTQKGNTLEVRFNGKLLAEVRSADNAMDSEAMRNAISFARLQG